jgi:hypothetical protein
MTASGATDAMCTPPVRMIDLPAGVSSVRATPPDSLVPPGGGGRSPACHRPGRRARGYSPGSTPRRAGASVKQQHLEQTRNGRPVAGPRECGGRLVGPRRLRDPGSRRRDLNATAFYRGRSPRVSALSKRRGVSSRQPLLDGHARLKAHGVITWHGCPAGPTPQL